MNGARKVAKNPKTSYGAVTFIARFRQVPECSTIERAARIAILEIAPRNWSERRLHDVHPNPSPTASAQIARAYAPNAIARVAAWSRWLLRQKRSNSMASHVATDAPMVEGRLSPCR